MREMSHEEWREFVSTGTRTGMLATVRSDGRPHVVPVWFLLDGDDVVFTTWHASVKGRNLRRDPRAALCVEDDAPPYAFVLLDGDVRISADVADVRHWATRIAARYMGADRAEQFGARNGVPGELLVRLSPARIIAQTDIAA